MTQESSTPNNRPESLALGREIILGVGGGIAAYKACDLLRRLKESGYLVTVIPTQNSLNFVGSATWEALSGRRVETNLWNNVHQVPHIQLAKKASMIVIAPTTADLLARLSSGRADDLLTNVVLASKAPLLLVPAMHPEMWLNPATIANVQTLRGRGITVLEPDVGALTGSDVGQGRFPESHRILDTVAEIFGRKADLRGQRILITAGGTREAIDPVRFIGNRSSGKQGFALALAAVRRGALVDLVAANSELADIEGVRMHRVESTSEMFTKVKELAIVADAVIMSAAVADARPIHRSEEKISKEKFQILELETNPDILKHLSESRSTKQILVGFAAETAGDIQDKGSLKLNAKGIDLLYVNDVSQGRIFGDDDSTGWIVDATEQPYFFQAGSKIVLADLLLDRIVSKLGYPND